jgi:hypothetical protein
MSTAQTGRTHDLHPTESRKPKESLDPWAPSTHDPEQRRLGLDIEPVRLTVDLEGDHVSPRRLLWPRLLAPI